jgi:hypothetical protein
MKTINLTFIPTTTVIDGEGCQKEVPHVIEYPAALFVAEQLEARTSTVNPLLEYTVAQSLRKSGTIMISEVDAAYIAEIIIALPIDNKLKGQILEVF